MNEQFVVIPSQSGSSGFVELARSQQGRLFKKQILRMDSEFVHPNSPGKKIHIDKAYAQKMQENFRQGLCDIVQVPIVNDANQHVEDPERNIGEVVDLTFDEKGVYAVIDARKHADDLGSTLLGASAYMHLNYPDTTTGETHGPTLLHVAVTNRPYITNLDSFEEIVAASADTSVEAPVVLIPAPTTEEKMELDQILTMLKDEHDIDVLDLQQKAEAGDSNKELVAALSGVVAPGTEAVTIKDVADAVIELAEERVALSSQVSDLVAANEAMSLKAAEDEIDGYIRAGRVLPKQRDAMISLSRNDRDTFDSLLPEDAIVALSESGLTVHDAPEAEAFEKSVERLAAIANGIK